MISRTEALDLAREYVQAQEEPGGATLVVLDAETLRIPNGWVFFYNTRRFAETGDDMDMAVGAAPVIITATTGELHVTGTAHPIEHYVRNLLEHGTCHPEAS